MAMYTFRRTLTIGLVTLAAATPLFTAAAHAAAAIGPPLNIVAIGDSFASGQGDMGSGWLDSACYRSAGAAPQRAAAQLIAQGLPVTFTSFACNGSVIENPPTGSESLLGPTGQLSQVSQLEGSNGNTPINALTVSIGGNDILFSNIVQECMVPLNSCYNDPNVDAALAYDLQQLGGYPSDPGRLGDLIDQINDMPYIQNVFLTEYPDPTTGADGNLCGSPSDPNLPFGGLDFISQADAYWAATSVIQPLDSALQSAVNMANSQAGTHAAWHYVSGISKAFYSHGYCNPGPRYINTVADSMAEQDLDTNGTMHPNAAGQQTIANVLYSDYLSTVKLSASASFPPVAGNADKLTIQAVSVTGTPIAGAKVQIDNASVGQTDSTGSLILPDNVFPTSGDHTITAQASGYSDPVPVILTVQPRNYSATANPSPVTVGTIPALTLTATDSANGQLVPGTFAFTAPGASTVTVRSGVTADNVPVSMGSKMETITGTTGKPIQIKVPLCPTLNFQPDSAAYATQNFSQLISCKP